MQSNLENLNASESFNSTPEIRFDGLQSFRMPESMTSSTFASAKNEATMLAFDGGSNFAIFDGEKETGKAGDRNGGAFEPRGDKDEKPKDNDDEHERGQDDAKWLKQLHGANENNAEFKDLKESLGRVKPNEMAPVVNELKNLKHDDAMQILKEKFDKMAGADKGIDMKELANEFENNKDPKQRAACIYATRYFADIAKAANWTGADWSGPVIDKADLDKAKKPAH